MEYNKLSVKTVQFARRETLPFVIVWHESAPKLNCAAGLFFAIHRTTNICIRTAHILCIYYSLLRCRCHLKRNSSYSYHCCCNSLENINAPHIPFTIINNLILSTNIFFYLQFKYKQLNDLAAYNIFHVSSKSFCVLYLLFILMYGF